MGLGQECIFNDLIPQIVIPNNQELSIYETNQVPTQLLEEKKICNLHALNA